MNSRDVQPRTTAFRVTGEGGRVILDTDDWVDALNAENGGRELRHVEGAHPTHEWGPPDEDQLPPRVQRCVKCRAWDNGSYGSQAPCGYDFRGRALATVLREELAARVMPVSALTRLTRGDARHRLQELHSRCLEVRSALGGEAGSVAGLVTDLSQMIADLVVMRGKITAEEKNWRAPRG